MTDVATMIDNAPPATLRLSEGLGAWDEDARRLLRLVTRLGITEIAGVDLHHAAAQAAEHGGLQGPSPECYLRVIRDALDDSVTPDQWRKEMTYERASFCGDLRPARKDENGTAD